MQKHQGAERFFNELCETYYEKVLRCLFAMLASEELARETVQETFLVAWQKREQLLTHPNPGGFLYLTARNLAQQTRRQAMRRLAHEAPDSDAIDLEQPDEQGGITQALDRAINEDGYIEAVLDELTPEKRKLYNMHYLEGRSMAEIAVYYSLEETTVRMRYVRLRREIKAIVSELAEKEFSF